MTDLLLVHADVVEHQQLAGLEFLNGLHGLGTVNVVDPLDLTAEQAPQFTGVAKGAGEVVFAGAGLVGEEDDLRLHEFLQGWQDGTDPRVVEEGLGSWVKRAVDVHAQQHGFAVDVDVVQREDLGH